MIIDEIKRIVKDSQILEQDDRKWPVDDKVGRQDLKISIDGKNMDFRTRKFGSFMDVKSSDDPNGLSVFYYFIQDIKCMVFSIINMHFRLKPVS